MKYLSILRYVISVLAVILVAMGIPDDGAKIDLALNWTYIVFGVAVAAAILFPAFNILSNPKGALRSLVGLAIIAVIVGIAYSLSSSETIVTSANVFDDPTALKLSDTGLYTTYVAAVLAIVSIFVGEISKIFK